MDREQAIQVLSELLNNCVKEGYFQSTSEVIVSHNALVVLAQASMPVTPPQMKEVPPSDEDTKEE